MAIRYLEKGLIADEYLKFREKTKHKISSLVNNVSLNPVLKMSWIFH